MVSVESGDPLNLGAPKSLFVVLDPAAPRYSDTFDNWGNAYHATRDGSQFLMVYQPRPEPLAKINVILNWFQELKERVPVP